MAVVDRAGIIRVVCRRIGIPKRKKPQNKFFSKDELHKLLSFVTLTKEGGIDEADTKKE